MRGMYRGTECSARSGTMRSAPRSTVDAARIAGHGTAHSGRIRALRGDPMSDISRRTFLTTTAAGAGLTILPRHVLGRGFQAPSDTVNIATVGFGGMGGSNTRRLMSQNIVAICDIDDALADAQLKRMQDDAAKVPAAPQQPQPQTVISKAQLAANARRPRVD